MLQHFIVLTLLLLNFQLSLQSSLVQKVLLFNKNAYSNSKILSEPNVISSADGRLTLNISVQTYRFKSIFSYNTRSYCINSVCSIPGPTISVRTGDIITVNLQNTLRSNTGMNSNGFLSHPNRTNFYMFGPHLDPQINSPFIYVDGANSKYVYTFQIPYDHAPGFYNSIRS